MSFTRLPKKYLLIGVAVIAAAGIGWNRFKPQPPPPTVHPEYRDLTQTLELSGSVDAKEQAEVHFPTTALLSWMGVQENQPVKKWQALARLDTRSLKKQLEQDMNTFNKQFRSHDQTLADTDYYDQTALTQELKRIVEQSHFDLQSTALQVELKDLAIKLSTVTSPIDGIVTKLSPRQAGVFVGLTDSIHIVNPKTVYFAVVVDEVDIGKIKEGQPAEIRLDAYPDDPITTTVGAVEFSPTASKKGGTGYRVHLSLPDVNEAMRYRLGMNGTALVTLEKKSRVLSVPVDALISRDDKTFVEVLENRKKIQREVTVGLETDEYAEILSGINENTSVVLPQSTEKQ